MHVRSTSTRTRFGATTVLAAVALLSAAGAAGATPLLISEVFYDASGSDDGSTFIELSGDPGTILDGLVIEGINGSGGGVTVTVVLSGVLPADGLFVVGDLDTGGLTTVVEADQLTNFDFQNGPDSVVLREGGLVLDALGYGVFSASLVFAGEGMPAPDAPAGSSLARVFADVDTDDNATDFLILAAPTPGTADFMAVPEPGSGVLALTGLLTLGAIARRARVAREKRPLESRCS